MRADAWAWTVCVCVCVLWRGVGVCSCAYASVPNLCMVGLCGWSLSLLSHALRGRYAVDKETGSGKTLDEFYDDLENGNVQISGAPMWPGHSPHQASLLENSCRTAVAFDRPCAVHASL